MSFTQERWRDLLVEYKALLDAFDEIVRDATAAEQAGQTLQVKYLNLIGNLERLRGLARSHFVVEWRDLNRNWKRNQRQAEIQRARRRKLGVVPRREHEGILGDYVPRGILALSPEQLEEEAEYARFNAGLDGAAPAKQDRDNPELDALRCQYDLGLANAPTEAQLAEWRADRARY